MVARWLQDLADPENKEEAPLNEVFADTDFIGAIRGGIVVTDSLL
jgi:hypothetical protein